MYSLKFTSQYKKNYKLMVKRGANMKLLEEVISTLMDGKTLDKKYKDHKLTGIFEGFRECHIQPDWLLIYLVEEEVLTLTLIATGSHSDMFN